MVRFPESERSVGDLENMYIRTPQGSQVLSIAWRT